VEGISLAMDLLMAPFPQIYNEVIAAGRAHLDEAAFAVAWATGRAMLLEQALAYALESVPIWERPVAIVSEQANFSTEQANRNPGSWL
jgi:hypothetical protein